MLNPTSNEFYATRSLFRSYIDFERPLSYEEWMSVPDDDKAAVLYVQFFDQITLAWYKLKSVYSNEADGVAEVLQYLSKNVDKIKSDKKRFTPAYIYKVCYNCLYCLCRDPNRYKKAYENECSNIVSSGEDELDLFDTVVGDSDMYEELNKVSAREYFWELIEDMDVDTKYIVAKLLGEDVDFEDGGSCYTGEEYQQKLHDSWAIDDEKERAKFMNRKAPKGHKVITEVQMKSVSPEKEVEIIAELRIKLAPFRAVFNF